MAAGDRVGNVYLDVLPKGDQFNSGVQALINKAERDAKFNVGANTKPAEEAVSKLSGQIQNDIGGAWIQAAAQAAAFTGAVFAVRSAVEGVVAKFSELFDGIAKARAGFNSILGEKAGENLLTQVRQFAIDSPFVTSELVQYSQQLLGVGKAANTIVPTLKNVGDIVASVGGDTSNLGSILYALTQIQTIGKLTGQDARQLQNQLVPITKYISEYTGKSVADVKKLQEAGGIASDVVFKAIEAQGKKVEGALNNSVRTIQGAKSVLSDTFRNFIQTSPALNNIYDDLVSGIQKFAAYISKPEIKRYIDEFLGSVGKLYESLKPLIAQFGELAGSGGLQALSAMTRILETLATVINAIPTAALTAIATALAAIATIKAPLALIQYASNIQRITTGLLGNNGLVSGLTRSKAAFAQQTVVTEQSYLMANQARQAYAGLAQQMALTAEQSAFLGRQFEVMNAKASLASRVASKFTNVNRQQVALGAGIAGGLIQSNTDPTNAIGQGAGAALTYGAIGLATAGPVGAAVGVAFGAVTGFLDAQDKKLQEQIEKNRELGQKAAQAYLTENAKLFSSATSESVNKVVADLAATQAKIDEIDKKRRARIDEYGGFDPLGFLPGDSAEDKINAKAQKQTALLESTLAEQKAISDKYVDPILDTVAKLHEAGNADAFLIQFKSPASVGSNPVKGFEELDAAFRQYGITLNDVVNDPAGALALVSQIESLDTAQKKAVVSANLLTEALKNAKGDSDAIYTNQIANLNSASAAITAADAAKKAAIATDAGGKTESEKQVADLAAQAALDTAKSLARTQAVANSVVVSDKAVADAKKAGLDVLAAYILANKEAAATAAGVAAEEKVSTDVTNAQTEAIRINTAARKAANAEADRARIGTGIAAAQGSLSALQSARTARGAALSRLADPNAQLAAQKALFDAQEAAANEAATKASARDRQALKDYLDNGNAADSVNAKYLNYKIQFEEATAKAAARQQVFNDVLSAGTEIQRYNAEVLANANLQRERSIKLTELQNRASVFSATASAVSANFSAARRPGDQGLQAAAQIATIQAVQAASDAAAFNASKRLVAQKQDLIDLGFTEADQNVRALNLQIIEAEAVARTTAETKELAKIEKDSAISRAGYNYATIQFLTNLQAAQAKTAAIYGDEIEKAQALAGFSSTIDGAAKAAADFATAASGAVVKGDIFSGVQSSAALAAINVQALTAQQDAANIALAFGASEALAAANGLDVYNSILEISTINIDKITKSVQGLNANLTSPEGAAAISSTVQRDAALAAAAIAAADADIARINGNANGFLSDDVKNQLAADKAIKAQNQHILDILSGRVPDDLGIFSSVSAGAQAIIQPQLDAEAKRKADEAAAALKKWQDSIISATESLTSRLEASAEAVAAAADRWAGSIKERTQYEQAVSVSRLTRNATSQAKDITEIAAGLANLRSRGVSDEVLKALGIDSVADTRQLRKLVKSSDSDLAKLNTAVSARGAQALSLATSEEQAAQKKTITEAILDAAKTLDLGTSSAEAAAIAASITINANMDAASIAAEILNALSGGKIG